MTQPNTQPIKVAFATDDTIVGGTYNGESTKLEPNAGFRAQGFKPGTKLPAPRANSILYEHGLALDSVIDSAPLTWERKGANTGQPNDNHWSNTRQEPGTVTVAPGALYSGVDSERLIQFNAAKLFLSADGHDWVDQGAHGISSNQTGFAVGTSNLGGTDYITIIGWEQEASGNVSRSDDLGGSWGAAGTLPAVETGVAAVGGYFNGRFFICSRSYLTYMDHAVSMSGAWTRITTSSLGWNGAPPPSPTCFAESPYACAIGIAGTPSLIYSLDGNTWNAAPLPTTPGDGIGRIHWSESQNVWVMTSQFNDRMFIASRTFGSVVEIPQIKDHNDNVVTGLHDVCSLGRTIVVAARDGLWASRGLETWRCIPMYATDDTVNDVQWTWLRKLNGRLWAGRCFQVSGNSSLQYAMSNVLGSEFSAQGAW